MQSICNSNNLNKIKMFSSNHLFYNCLKNSIKITNNIQNKCFYSTLKSFGRFLDNKNRQKLWSEYRAVRRLLADIHPLVGPKTISANNLFKKSFLYSNESQNKDTKTNNKTNTNQKNETNRNYDNEDKDEDPEDEPKSSLLAKAIVWMLSGFEFKWK